MSVKRLVPVVLFLSIATISASAQTKKLTADEAKDHVGEHATVCGHVASTRYASTSKGQPTFLNLDKRYPEQIFTILIWAEDRPKFGEPEMKYRDKDVCVTGTIKNYRGKPETEVSDPKQIEIR